MERLRLYSPNARSTCDYDHFLDLTQGKFLCLIARHHHIAGADNMLQA